MAEFLYLNQEDLLKSGVNDPELCIQSAADSFALLSQGDYLMGGPRGHAHGMLLVFPKEPPFPGYPVNNGNDHRFTAMPAYAGGRFHCAGMKWISSNTDNQTKNLERGNSFILLNDPDTGLLFCAASANQINAMRSAAGAAVAVKYLGGGAKTLALIGAGQMNRAALALFPQLMPQLERIRVYDVLPQKSLEFCRAARSQFGLEVEISSSMEEAFFNADAVHLGQNRPFFLKKELVKPGALLLISSVCQIDPELVRSSNIYMDQLKTHQIWREEDPGAGIPTFDVLAAADRGELRLEEITDIGAVHDGSKRPRQNGKTNLFYWMGMPLMDITLAYDLYQAASKAGYGTVLRL